MVFSGLKGNQHAVYLYYLVFMPRIILSLSLITVVVGALAFGATNAFFSDAETSLANVFAAGAIDLKVDNDSYYNGVFNEETSWEEADLNDGEGPSEEGTYRFFEFFDLKPDDYGEDTISLHVDTNDAFLCANVILTSNDDNGINEPESEVDTTDGSGEGELADLVEFLWWADDGDNVLEDGEELLDGSGAIGNLPLGVPYALTLADSDENVWGGAGPVDGDTTYYLGKAWCFGEIAAAPLGEGEYEGPDEDNNGNQTPGEPEDGGITCDGSELGNESQTDSLTADIIFEAVQARHNEGFQCEVTQLACEPEQAFADHVVDWNQGERKNGTPVLGDRSDPTDVLGAPQSNGDASDSPVVAGSFFSLGFDEEEGDGTPNEGGWIIVEFQDNVIVDGPGDDLQVWEVTGGNYPDELIKLEASQDNSTWFPIATGLTRDATADLASSGLAWAKYVRLTDVSIPGEFSDATADGYDLDAFSALNCAQVPD